MLFRDLVMEFTQHVSMKAALDGHQARSYSIMAYYLGE